MAYDKKLHFYVGFLISVLGNALLTPLWGFLGAVFAGAFKEYYDSLGYGDSDIHDFGATALGGLVPSLAVVIIKSL